MTSELKPCPFCGSAPQLRISELREVSWVECPKCMALGGPGGEYNLREEAIAAWNTRPLEEAAERAGMERAAGIVDEKAASCREILPWYPDFAKEIDGIAAAIRAAIKESEE